MQHWAGDDRESNGSLYVDGRAVAKLGDAVFLSAPVWDPEERRVAIIARLPHQNPKAFVIDGGTARLQSVRQLSEAGEERDFAVSWTSTGLEATGRQLTWKIDPKRQAPVVPIVDHSPSNAGQQAVHDALSQELQALGDLSGYDYLCTGCTKDRGE